LTRLTISVGTLVAAVLLDSPTCLLLLGTFAVLVPAAAAGVLRHVLWMSLSLSLPLAVSVVVVNVLFPVDGTVVAEIGPLSITSAGMMLAASVLARVLTMAGAVVLFYLTTSPSRLVASLRFHGVPGRATFVIHSGVSMIPRMAARAGEVTEAQRARGLDTEGRVWRRARGVLAVAAPTVLGSLREVETRTLALESRGFTWPGRPTLLWTPHDGPWQRLLRWMVVLAVVTLVVARLFGIPGPC
jgi:energy-coupling factor transport system permease protein